MLSIAASVTLVAGGITKIVDAATKDKIPEDKPEYAMIQYLKSLNCSQSILETYAPSFGISVIQTRSFAAAFAGGTGMGLECCSVTGAFIILGLKCGKTTDSISHTDDETFNRVIEFTKEFKKQPQAFKNSLHTFRSFLVLSIKSTFILELYCRVQSHCPPKPVVYRLPTLFILSLSTT